MTDQITVPLYNPDMPEELKGEALKRNSEALGQLAAGKGMNILASIQSKIEQDITSATPVNISALTSAFSSSGGTFLIVANIDFANSTAVNNFVYLYLDGALKTKKASFINGTIYGNLILVWIEKLSQGNHKVEIKASTTGGTFSTPYLAASELFIAEILL